MKKLTIEDLKLEIEKLDSFEQEELMIFLEDLLEV